MLPQERYGVGLLATETLKVEVKSSEDQVDSRVCKMLIKRMSLGSLAGECNVIFRHLIMTMQYSWAVELSEDLHLCSELN